MYTILMQSISFFIGKVPIDNMHSGLKLAQGYEPLTPTVSPGEVKEGQVGIENQVFFKQMFNRVLLQFCLRIGF